MVFSQSPFASSRAPRQTPASVGPSYVFGVGSHAFVAHQQGDVSLDDGSGKVAVGELADGTEVEIIAWRPRRASTLYRVRATESRIEGWVSVTSLRRSREPANVSAVVPASRTKL